MGVGEIGKCFDSTDEAEGSGHQRIDERSLAMHPAIAEKLRAEPGLLAIARENLDRWQDQAGRSRPYLEEWRRILDFPLQDLLP